MSEDQANIIAQIAQRTGGLGVTAAEIAGQITEVHQRSEAQSGMISQLISEVEQMVSTNHNIGQTVEGTRQSTAAVAGDVQTSQKSIQDAVEGIYSLVSGVQNMETQLGSLSAALESVAKVAAGIEGIASQTNLLALNATIEAARAGEAGKGFAVVANEVKSLATETRKATEEISDTVKELTSQVNALKTESHTNTERAETVQQGTTSISDIFESLRSNLDQINTNVGDIATVADQNRSQCDTVARQMSELISGNEQTSQNLATADNQAQELLKVSEMLIEVIANSGHQTEDSPFIDKVKEVSAAITSEFEAALDAGQITMDDLFDENYMPIPGSDPEQVMTRFTEFTDRVLPPLQEPVLDFSPNVVFCAAVDRNAYLPTHNNKFSHPQKPGQSDWNAGNCRNRRIFDDRTGMAAAKNTNPILLQTYRRDMGGGNFVTMKDLSAPIMVKGRHWGGLRLAYKPAEN
ncbi:methyl-accepting chemotaxis protein [Sneathiella limimaris]|uniref:methyl-accepting chemotaxis protein n=1 Tax=Sneathiella limimaris TaxID=1964213 RepID=UPI00146B6D66|nr:methyl-accepting chemotaxis protein [Sneathiella limimaris]